MKKIDPLYLIFEQHLYNFQDSDTDRPTFIANVAKEYLSYLRKLKLSVPQSLESLFLEEVSSQVHTMLLKKIYGCLSIEEYRKGVATKSKRQANRRYARLSYVAKKVSAGRPRKRV